VETPEDDIEDPVVEKLKRMSRYERRYGPTLENIFKAPGLKFPGKDLTVNDPMDPNFFHPKYCYQVHNLRIRRSRLGK